MCSECFNLGFIDTHRHFGEAIKMPRALRSFEETGGNNKDNSSSDHLSAGKLVFNVEPSDHNLTGAVLILSYLFLTGEEVVELPREDVDRSGPTSP